MKTTALVGSLKALAVIMTFCACSGAHKARAGELSVYFKSGWFTWDEKVNGSSFVKETGAMEGAGLTRTDVLSGLSFAESAEVDDLPHAGLGGGTRDRSRRGAV